MEEKMVQVIRDVKLVLFLVESLQLRMLPKEEAQNVLNEINLKLTKIITNNPI